MIKQNVHALKELQINFLNSDGLFNKLILFFAYSDVARSIIRSISTQNEPYPRSTVHGRYINRTMSEGKIQSNQILKISLFLPAKHIQYFNNL